MPYQIQQLQNRISFIGQFFASRKTTLVPLVLLTTLLSFFHKINKPPKNLRHFPTLSLFQFYKNALRNELFETYSKKAVLPLLEHNGIYVRPSVTGWALSVANPAALKQLLLRQENVYPKAPTVLVKGSLIDRFVGGPNIFFTSGSEWKRHKQIANPAFQRSMPVTLFGDLAIKSFRAIEREGLDEVDVLALFEKLTLDAIGIAGFGTVLPFSIYQMFENTTHFFEQFWTLV